jgi:hypothetical protein
MQNMLPIRLWRLLMLLQLQRERNRYALIRRWRTRVRGWRSWKMRSLFLFRFLFLSPCLSLPPLPLPPPSFPPPSSFRAKISDAQTFSPCYPPSLSLPSLMLSLSLVLSRSRARSLSFSLSLFLSLGPSLSLAVSLFLPSSLVRSLSICKFDSS